MFSQTVLISMITALGYAGIFGVVFAESGLLFGLILPGDSLLFIVGLLASRGFLNIWIVLPVIFVAAVLGDNLGYAFGHKVGRRFFHRKDSMIFRKENLIKAELFYEKHGPITVFSARFIPFIRTLIPILTGIGKMNYKTFLFYNITGALSWTLIVTLLGYYIPAVIPNADQYLPLIFIGVVIISFAPAIYQILRKRR